MAAYVIGVDVGYGNTKTAHTCFSSGVKKLPGKPPLATRDVYKRQQQTPICRQYLVSTISFTGAESSPI